MVFLFIIFFSSIFLIFNYEFVIYYHIYLYFLSIILLFLLFLNLKNNFLVFKNGYIYILFFILMILFFWSFAYLSVTYKFNLFNLYVILLNFFNNY